MRSLEYAVMDIFTEKIINNFFTSQSNNKTGTDFSELSTLKQLYEIYSKFVSAHNNGAKYISLNNFNYRFTKEDKKIINQHNDLFYFFTTNRVLLVIKVLDSISNLFKEKSGGILFSEAYECIRKAFSINKANRRELKKLFCCEYVITYSQFQNAQVRIKNAIKAFDNLHENNLGKLKTDYNDLQLFEKLKAHIENILGLNGNPILSETELSETDHVVLNKLKRAIEDTDIEFCRLCFKYPEKVKPIIIALNDFSRPFILQKENSRILSEELDKIDDVNKSASITSLIEAFTGDENLQDVLNSKFNQCKKVSDLKSSLKDISFHDDEQIQILDFLDWLKTNLRQLTREAFLNILKDKRQMRIVKGRSEGITLEELGQQIGVTRERIRQIEYKFENRFLIFCSRFKPHYIILSFSNSNIFFTDNDINKVFKENSAIFKYFLKRIKASNIIWSNELNAFIIGDNNWYKKVLKEINELSTQIDYKKITNIIADIKEKIFIPVEDKIIEKLILSTYRKIGNFYSKNRISKKEIYKVVFEEFYPNGMKLFDDFEIMRFKQHVKDVFPELNFDKEETRAICARITDFTILCDRGKYILPSAIKIEEELLNRIFNHIYYNERSTILYAEIFEQYKSQLLKHSNIHNRYFLQGVLKYYYKNDFTFYRDYICLDDANDRNIKTYIEEFIKEKKGPVKVKEIKKEFTGITDITINNNVATCSDILQWGFGEYIHFSNIKITESDKTKLLKFLDDSLIVDKLVSTKVLFEDILISNNNLLYNNGINNHFSLFSLYKYFCSDKYQFKRPYISHIGVKQITSDAIIEQFLGSIDKFRISELKSYIEDKKIKIMDFSLLIDNKCRDFLRVDEDMMIRKSMLNVNKENIGKIEDSIIATLGEKGYMVAKKFESFFFFPYLGVKWTPFMLVSFIKSFSSRLEISKYSTDYRHLNEIIVNKTLNASNHNELINYALKYENDKSLFKSITEIEDFLRGEGLIAHTLPKSFLKKSYIDINESGLIKII